MFDTKLKKRIALSTGYLFFATLIELSIFIATNQSIPPYFVMDFCAIAIIGAGLFAVPFYQLQVRLVALFLTVQVIVSYINQTLYFTFADFLSLSMLRLLNSAIEAVAMDFFNIGYFIFLAVILVLSLAFCTIVNSKKLISKENLFWKPLFVSVTSIFILSSIYSFTLQINTDTDSRYKIEDKNYAYNTLLNKQLAIKSFGFFPYYFKELKVIFFEEKTIDKDKTLSFFKNSPINEVNSYTGILKDHNAIFFLLESLEWFVIDPELTPTLYRLSNEGMTYRQYYSKNKTNHSEIIALTGHYPSDENLLLDEDIADGYSNDSFPYSLPNLLKKDGVETLTYLHGYYGYFYNRLKLMPKLGFNKTLFLDGMNVYKENLLFGDWARDSELIKANLNAIAPTDGKRFFSHYTTITTHGTYRYIPRLQPVYDRLDKLRPNLKQENPRLYYYQAAAMDVDDGITALVKHLEENNLLDSTLLVLYSDHYAFYHNLSYRMKGIDFTDAKNIEIYRVPLIMYSTKLGAHKNDRFISSYNIVPTVLDLMGIPFQTHFYSSHSAFDPRLENDVFVSKTGGIFNHSIFSQDGNHFVSPTDAPMTAEQINTFRDDVAAFYDKQEQIDKIYQFDIFNPSK